jgi:hypothetical protein
MPFLIPPQDRTAANVLVVKGGWEESYHAWQAKDPQKSQEIIDACKEQNPNNPLAAYAYIIRADSDGRYSDDTAALGARGIAEIDADAEYEKVKDKIQKIAVSVSRTR